MATTLFVSDYPYLIAVVLLSPGASANNVSVFPDVKYNSSESLWVLNLIEDLQYRIYYSEELYSGPSDAITESSGGVSYDEVSGSTLTSGLSSSSYPHVIAIMEVLSSTSISSNILSVYKSGSVWKCASSNGIYSTKTYGVYYFLSSDALLSTGSGATIKYFDTTTGTNIPDEYENIVGAALLDYESTASWVYYSKTAAKPFGESELVYSRKFVACYGFTLSSTQFNIRVYYF